MEHLTFLNRNCEIHYRLRKGSGDKFVLFFHGAGADHRMFESQMNVFDSSYNLVLWDARGQGESKLIGTRFDFEDMVDDSLKLFQVLNIKTAIIVGMSMGGNLAQEIAYRFPEKAEKIVLIDCARNTGKLSKAERLTLKLSKAIFALYPWKVLVSQSAKACSKNPEVVAYIKSCFEKLDKDTITDILLSLLKVLHYDSAFRFKQPVLLLCGTEYPKGNNIKKNAESWALEDENITFHWIENAGHCSNMDAPDVVNAHIRQFLDS